MTALLALTARRHEPEAPLRAISVGERPQSREVRGAGRLMLGLAGALIIDCGLLGLILVSPSRPPDADTPPIAVTLVGIPPPAPPMPRAPAPAAPAPVATPLALRAVPVMQAAPAVVGDGAPPMPPALPADPAELPLPRRLPRLRPPVEPPLRRLAALPAGNPAHETAVVAPPITATAPAIAAAALAAVQRSSGAAAVDSLEGQLREAVQAALRYPPAARMMGRTGRSRVAFVWCDGKAADAHVVSPSDLPAFNVAALDAVRDADYPSPPADLLHHTLKLSVWVDFTLAED